MFVYTENDTGSHINTKNINIYPKTHQQHEHPFQFFKKQKKGINKSNNHIFRKISLKTSAF